MIEPELRRNLRDGRGPGVGGEVVDDPPEVPCTASPRFVEYQ